MSGSLDPFKPFHRHFTRLHNAATLIKINYTLARQFALLSVTSLLLPLFHPRSRLFALYSRFNLPTSGRQPRWCALDSVMGLKKKKMGNQREKEEERRGRGSTGRVSEVVARTNRQKERSRQRKCSEDRCTKGREKSKKTDYSFLPPHFLTIIFRMKNWKYSKSKNKKRKSCQAFDLPVFSVE